MNERGGWLPFLAALSVAACGGGLPKPPSGPTPADALFEVPFPPPPSRVETIPPPKDEREVWVDGQWDWDGKDYRWQPGGWVLPPSNAYFSRWTSERRKDGRLYFAPAAWRDEQGRSLDLWPSFTAGCPRDDAPARSTSKK